MQGYPFAMPFYALATVPLIHHLDEHEDLQQVWYANDASASGSLSSAQSWWDKLSTVGPGYGYHPNASKTWLHGDKGTTSGIKLFGEQMWT